MHPLIAVVTIATVLLLIAMVFIVGRARGRHQVQAPATTGPDGFERAYRVQMNTQESTLMFLPSLWVAAQFGDPRLAALFGAVWLLARIAYAIAYLDPARSRTIPFVVGSLMVVLLLAQAIWGLAWTTLLS